MFGLFGKFPSNNTLSGSRHFTFAPPRQKKILMSPYIKYYKWYLSLFLIGTVYGSTLRADDGDRTVDSNPPPTIVAATISLNGNPLKGGRIFFHLPKNQFAGGKIESGKCQLDCVPAGTHKVTIESKGLPKRYSLIEVTALIVQIAPGNNQFAFELTSN